MNRNARRTRAAALELAGRVAQDKYRRSCLAILRGVHAAYMSALAPNLQDVAKGHVRQDSGVSVWKRKLDHLDKEIKKVREPAGKAFDLMAQRTNQANFNAAKTLLGLTPKQTGVAEHIATVREENLDLIEAAGRAYAEDVREVMSDPDTFGMRVEDLKAKLIQRGSVSESRAELIARDQTLKLNAGLNKIRQTNAGVARYIWSTSRDERVRPMHQELDGEEFSWTEPPVTNDAGDTNHPGEDFQCRCVAVPIIEETEEEPDEEG